MTCKAILNELTREELATIQSRVQRKEKECDYCGVVSLMMPQQRFCSPAHRVAMGRAFHERQMKWLESRVRDLERENEELVKEISTLRKE